ncbi:MAG: phosphate regulon sensor histidine kinase PhoR [Proteobacteria bacterium]|nr:phosphate regulon sensor histidine kinase PhoR [Pseudomonadota bacterium]
MSEAARKTVLGIVLILAIGAGIGWMYGRPETGLLIAAVACLLWQIRQLLSFERALRTGDFDDFRHGEGIWEQMFSRFQFERDRAVRRKKEYRGLLREIRKSTNAMPDGAVILDADNEIVGCNRAAKELAGLRRKKDRGQRVDNILRDPELTRLLLANDYTATINMASPVGHGGWLNCRVVPYGADQKLLLMRDVTDRMRLSKMRRDFVANASHELRSPLTVISGYLDTLAEAEDMPAGWIKPVMQMQAQANRMKMILGELLQLSRLEAAGPASLDDTIDVVQLLERSKQAFEGHAHVAAIGVLAESAARLRGNQSEIETVVVNLLSNAVRHTPRDGTITLAWRSGAKGADLIVTDTGEGIDAEFIPRLTERFFRVDKGRSRDDGGTGLGLAIVKHVLVRHDADLVVSSEPGRGSTFRCRFPADRVVDVPIAEVS